MIVREAMDLIDPGKDGPIGNIGVLRDARAKVAARGGELLYTACEGFYVYDEFLPESWSDCSRQEKMAIAAFTRQRHIAELNKVLVDSNGL